MERDGIPSHKALLDCWREKRTMKTVKSKTLWTILILALLILMALSAQPCFASLLWSG